MTCGITSFPYSSLGSCVQVHPGHRIRNLAMGLGSRAYKHRAIYEVTLFFSTDALYGVWRDFYTYTLSNGSRTFNMDVPKTHGVTTTPVRIIEGTLKAARQEAGWLSTLRVESIDVDDLELHTGDELW